MVNPLGIRSWRFAHRFGATGYDLIADLLDHSNVRGFALRGTADPIVLRLACREQFRRCGNDFPETASEVFPIAVLGLDGGPSLDPDSGDLIGLDARPAWTRCVRWQFEGLSTAGLFFDEGGYGAADPAYMHSSMTNDGIDAILVTCPPRDLQSQFAWFSHADGLFLGLKPDSLGQWVSVLSGHDLKRLAVSR